MASQSKTVVVCVDDSEKSEYALRYAIDQIVKPEDFVRILHIQGASEHLDEIHESGLVDPLYHVSVVSEESIAIMSKFLKICKESSLENYKEDVITQGASIGESLCAYAEDQAIEDPSMILVIGSRELGFFDKAFLGSVGEYLVKNSSCPVLVVKSPKILLDC